MKSLMSLALFSLLVATGGACGDDDGGSPDAAVTLPDAFSDAMADTLPVDANNVDAPATDTSTATCTMEATYEDPTFAEQLASGSGTAADPLQIQVDAKLGNDIGFFFGSNTLDSVPLGKQTMEGQWLDGNCELCFYINARVPGTDEIHLWFPVSGELEIVSVVDNFILRGTNVVMQHVNFVGDTVEVEPAPDGCKTTLKSFEINTPMLVGSL
ncbi:MAG: hypothetical protein JRH20_28240 [Deltaproteobacteria bacterium]|nr:hypothetical protein [Deltaproteobacteria bacterium]